MEKRLKVWRISRVPPFKTHTFQLLSLHPCGGAARSRGLMAARVGIRPGEGRGRGRAEDSSSTWGG